MDTGQVEELRIFLQSIYHKKQMLPMALTLFSSTSIKRVFWLSRHLGTVERPREGSPVSNCEPLVGSALRRMLRGEQRGRNMQDSLTWPCRLPSKVTYTWGQSRDSEWHGGQVTQRGEGGESRLPTVWTTKLPWKKWNLHQAGEGK